MKKERTFHLYITKVLRNITIVNKLPKITKDCINTILYVLLQKISYLVFCFMIDNHKKIVVYHDIKRIISMLFTGDLRTNSLSEGENAINSYKNKDNILVFPHNLIKKILKNNGYYNINISKYASIYTASVIEYFVSQILELGCIYTLKNNKIYITVEYLNASCKEDIEINSLLLKLNTDFYKKNNIPINNIDKQQLYFPKSIFRRIAKDFFNKNKIPLSRNLKFSHNFFNILQYYIEQYLIKILNLSIKITKNSNRSRLNVNDIMLVKEILN